MTEERRRREVQGKRIRMARAGANLSRTRFAALISELWEDVSREYVRRVEIGDKDPGHGFLIAASKVTGWPLPWFTDLDEEVIHVMSSNDMTLSPSPRFGGRFGFPGWEAA